MSNDTSNTPCLVSMDRQHGRYWVEVRGERVGTFETSTFGVRSRRWADGHEEYGNLDEWFQVLDRTFAN
jgi:hypothetical protein